MEKYGGFRGLSLRKQGAFLGKKKEESERQTYGKVDGKVAFEAWMDDRIMVTRIGVGGIDGLHAAIEAKDEVVEIETKAEAIRHGYLSPELVEAELTARLVGIVAYGPNVARIEESGSIDFPKKMGTILYVHVQLHVARLIDEVDTSVLSLKRTRPQAAHRPSAHAVGTAAEVTLLVGQDVAVAVGIGNAKADMEREGIVGRESEALGEVKVALDILRIGDIEQSVLVQTVL